MGKMAKSSYQALLGSIGMLLHQARMKVWQQVNNILVRTYWEIGRHIVIYEQEKQETAAYGSRLLDKLASDLKDKYGKGFSRRNVLNMRTFYLSYKNWQTVSAVLSWSHLIELLSLDDQPVRSFYEKECIANKWSVRELRRQMDSMLYERLVIGRTKREVLKLASRGQVIVSAHDIIKDPYVLEFLGLPEHGSHSEKELEQKIVDNMQSFLLELGRGFAFVARQFRISLNNKHFSVDLVFYHRILKCFVLFDLKLGKVTHQDIGQMNLYLNYFKKEEMVTGDNEPVGIVLGAEKDQVLVEYALGGISNKLFASRYRLELPDKKLLQAAVGRIVGG